MELSPFCEISPIGTRETTCAYFELFGNESNNHDERVGLAFSDMVHATDRSPDALEALFPSTEEVEYFKERIFEYLIDITDDGDRRILRGWANRLTKLAFAVENLVTNEYVYYVSSQEWEIIEVQPGDFNILAEFRRGMTEVADEDDLQESSEALAEKAAA